MATVSFAPIAPAYDLMNDVLSFGLHRRWKRKLAKRLVELGSDGAALDVATGTGEVAELLEKAGSRVVGVDPCAAMMEVGKQKGRKVSSWVCAPSEKLPFADESFTRLSCAFGVRNFDARPVAFAEWARVLAPGGVAGVLEIHPLRSSTGPSPTRFYWDRIVPLLGALVGEREGYRYLSESASRFLSREGLVSELEKSGLTLISSQSVFGRGMVSLSFFRK